MEYRVISIGTLSHNRLWNEAAPVRTAHATTTFVTEGQRRILVDPSLPAPALAARFQERTGRTLDEVTDVFCTTLRPVHRRAIEEIDQATWWVSEQELELYGRHLEGLAGSAERLGADDRKTLAADRKLLERFRPAPQQFGEQVTVYPMAGPSPGSAGLLLTEPTCTLVVAGDAVVTREHLEAGQVWDGCWDTAAAVRTLQDLLELADAVICGHDNLVLLRRHWLGGSAGL